MCLKSLFFQGAGYKICVSAMFWIFRKWTWMARKSHHVQTISIYITLLYNSWRHTHVPEKSIFLGTGCKICVPVKFRFCENWLRRLIELIEYNQKTSLLCYYIDSRRPALVPENSVFQELAVKFAFWRSLDFEKNKLHGLVERIK